MHASRACVVAARQTRAQRGRYDPPKVFRVIDGAARFTTRASASGVAETHEFGQRVDARVTSESCLVAASVGSCKFDYAL